MKKLFFRVPVPVTIFICLLLLSFQVFSKEKSFTREYTYQASEADSKISARAVALGQVKQLLLEELGSYVYSTFVVTSVENEKFTEMSNSQVKSITAGISQTQIVDERWDGKEYYLKANITVDEEILKKQLDEIANNKKQLAELEALQRRTDSAFAEIEQLRLQLQLATDESEKQDLQKRYKRMTKSFADATMEEDRPRMEVVFVLDATGSMGSMIANAKDKIWAIATTMAQSEPAPKLSIGLIAYRDRTDEYITRQLPMTDNIDDLYTQLLGVNAAGGGDMPESVNQALAEAVFDFQWDTKPTTLRTIYLVGDCPPHMDYQDDIKYQESYRGAAQKDIIINTVQCGANVQTKMVWQEIAQNTNGEYLSLNQAGNSLAVTTPYDAELARKARELDKTRMYYGKEAVEVNHKKSKQTQEIYDNSKPEEEARRGIYNVTTTSGKKSFLGENELVDAYANDELEIDEIEDGLLPQEMKEMTISARKDYLDNKVKERTQIEDEIKELNSKRDKYIQKELETKGVDAEKSFNGQLHAVFSKQASKKNYKTRSSPKY